MPAPASPRKSQLRSLIQRGWIQDQHGAWPMALIPLLLGAALSGWQWVHTILLLAWLSGFHFFNAATILLKGRRSSRIRARLMPALTTWGVASSVLGGILVFWHPQLFAWLPAFVPLIAIAFIEAWRRQERSMLARLSTILASSLMLPLAFWLGVGSPAFVSMLGGTWTRVWLLTGIVAAYFIGTVPYVRSLIRGKNDLRWVMAAFLWHMITAVAIAVVASSTLISWWLVALWGVLAARTVLVPGIQRRGVEIRPAVIGVGEFVLTALLLILLLAL